MVALFHTLAQSFHISRFIFSSSPEPYNVFMKGVYFYTPAVSFFLGVLVFSYLDFTPVFLFAALIFLSIASVLVQNKRKIVLMLLIIFSFTVGVVRIEFAERGLHNLDSGMGQKVKLEGFVCDEFVERDTSARFCFKPENSSDRILITTGKYPSYEYGQAISIAGKLSSPENFQSYEGGPEFDYKSYLAKNGVRYTMFQPEIIDLGENRGNAIKKTMLGIKGFVIERMEQLISEPQSSILGGILLGDRASIPKDITEDFKRAGLVHILVLSGYNVTIVAESLMRLFSFLSKGIGRSLGIISIILFAIMTGASSTTVRASIMAFIVIAAKFSSRPYNTLRALIAAACTMVLWNPLILAFDISFELSFLATLSLVLVSPLLSEKLWFVTNKMNLRETISTTASTQFFVAPFLLYSMGQISLISFVSNIFVLPFIPYAMLAGFVTLIMGLINQTIALIPAVVSSTLLSIILKLVYFFSSMPFASIQIHASMYMLACSYLLYAILLIYLWRRKNFSLRFPN
jgi:competence protein ComEC